MELNKGKHKPTKVNLALVGFNSTCFKNSELKTKWPNMVFPASILYVGSQNTASLYSDALFCYIIICLKSNTL